MNKKRFEHTDEFKQKVRERMSGAAHFNAKKIMQLDLQGNFINYFQTITDASLCVGVSKQAIHQCLKGSKAKNNKSKRYMTVAGYRWQYAV